MKPRLRSRFFRNAVVSILGCGLATAIVILVAGELLFREAYGAAQESSLLEARSRFSIFDYFVSGAEERVRGISEAALRDLALRYPDARSFAGASAAELRARASALGVTEIYLVGPEGRVRATSFEPDFGFDLFSAGAKSAASLRSLYGSGRIAHQSLSQSALTGIVGSYHYYSPAGSDILIEVSTSLRDAIAGSHPGGYEEFLARILGESSDGESSAGVEPRGQPGRRPLARIVDLVGLSVGTVWSFVDEGRSRSELLPLVEEARRTGSSTRVRGRVQTLLRRVGQSAPKGEIAGERRFAVIELDLAPMFRFRLLASLAAAFACALSGGISFLSAKRAFDRMVAERVDRLESSMARIAAGDYESGVSVGEGDEIGEIERGVAAMVKTISDRGAQLASSLAEKEELLREVHHRVKNNLQVIESLVSLQIGQSPDREVVKALGETRTRVHGMALVHEQLYDGASLAGVDLGACLEGIAADVAQDRRRAGQDIALRVEAQGLSLSADRALPACLAAAELVANCFDHAFAGRSEGVVALRAVGTGRGGFVLSVEDDGLGAGPGPLREGLGLGIARALSAQLGGELRRERGSAGGERFVLEARCRG